MIMALNNWKSLMPVVVVAHNPFQSQYPLTFWKHMYAQEMLLDERQFHFHHLSLLFICFNLFLMVLKRFNMI